MKKSSELAIGTVKVAQLLSGDWVASFWGGYWSGGWQRLDKHFGSQKQAIEAGRVAADDFAPDWKQVPDV